MMTSVSADRPNPLSRPAWRFRHSAWLLAPIFGLGLFSFVGFVYIALRARTRKLWIAAVIACVATAGVWVANAIQSGRTDDGDGGSWAGGVLFAVWVGLIVYGLIVNRDYLRWRAGGSTRRAWYDETHAVPATAALAPPPFSPVAAAPAVAPTTPSESLLSGVDQAQYYAAPAAPAPPESAQPAPAPQVAPAVRPAPAPHVAPAVPPAAIDVNRATAEQLVASLGIDTAFAARITTVRDARGGFSDLDDLTTAMRLQPHELVRLRGRVAFESRPAAQHAAPPESGQGRILDF